MKAAFCIERKRWHFSFLFISLLLCLQLLLQKVTFEQKGPTHNKALWCANVSRGQILILGCGFWGSWIGAWLMVMGHCHVPVDLPFIVVAALSTRREGQIRKGPQARQKATACSRWCLLQCKNTKQNIFLREILDQCSETTCEVLIFAVNGFRNTANGVFWRLN